MSDHQTDRLRMFLQSASVENEKRKKKTLVSAIWYLKKNKHARKIFGLIKHHRGPPHIRPETLEHTSSQCPAHFLSLLYSPLPAGNGDKVVEIAKMSPTLGHIL